MESKQEIYNIIRAKGQRLTTQKRITLEILLKNADRMLSVQDIKSYVNSEDNIDNATIYRNIQNFMRLGILESMLDGSGVFRYTLNKGHKHHHHLICIECGGIICIPCKNKFWESFANENKFEELYHKIEIYGKCLKCKANVSS